MSIGQTSCIYRSNTFFGSFKVIGEGPEATICVRYNGEEIEASVGDRAVESAAEDLLTQLVTREAISMTVAAAEKRGLLADIQLNRPETLRSWTP